MPAWHVFSHLKPVLCVEAWPGWPGLDTQTRFRGNSPIRHRAPPPSSRMGGAPRKPGASAPEFSLQNRGEGTVFTADVARRPTADPTPVEDVLDGQEEDRAAELDR